MRHEVIKLTDEAIYPELIKLLESKGEKICHETKTYSATRFAIGHDGNFWIGCEGFNGITITDVDFLQKYGENTEPESDSKIVGADMICPITKKHCDDECCTIGSECNMSGDEISNTEPEANKERELLEGFRDYLKTRGIWSWTVEIDNFLSSLRKPAFELITADNVKVTDPEQRVFFIDKRNIANCLAKNGKAKGYTCYNTVTAAKEWLFHNTPAIKLSDMIYDASTGYYVIHKEGAHNLVNEQIK